jgi:hypothetical protein
MAEESIRDRICYHNREVRALGDYVDLGWLASRGNENTATSSERGGEEKPAARRGRATLAHALPSRYPSPANCHTTATLSDCPLRRVQGHSYSGVILARVCTRCGAVADCRWNLYGDGDGGG